MKSKHPYVRGFTLVELLVVIAIIAALAGIAVPVILKQQKKAALAQALSNAKEIGLALMNFDNDYGGFPDSTTVATVQSNTGTSLTLGTSSSNDFFRQLIATSYVDSDKIFYSKAAYTIKPSGNITGAACLSAGEVGFGYIMGSATAAISDSLNSSCPLVFTPLQLSCAADGTADDTQYDSKAVVLCLDQSASSLTIRQSDKMVILSGGTTGTQAMTMLQVGTGTVWGTTNGLTPTIKPPVPKGSGG